MAKYIASIYTVCFGFLYTYVAKIIHIRKTPYGFKEDQYFEIR